MPEGVVNHWTSSVVGILPLDVSDDRMIVSMDWDHTGFDDCWDLDYTNATDA